MSWDAAGDWEKILKERFPAEPGFLILDEIHKYSRWRQVVKGLFDKRGDELQILVAGSASLDHSRFLPLTCAELGHGSGIIIINQYQ